MAFQPGIENICLLIRKIFNVSRHEIPDKVVAKSIAQRRKQQNVNFIFSFLFLVTQKICEMPTHKKIFMQNRKKRSFFLLKTSAHTYEKKRIFFGGGYKSRKLISSQSSLEIFFPFFKNRSDVWKGKKILSRSFFRFRAWKCKNKYFPCIKRCNMLLNRSANSKMSIFNDYFHKICRFVAIFFLHFVERSVISYDPLS